MKPGQKHAPVDYSFKAFTIDAKTGHIIKELSHTEARHALGVNLDDLEW